MTPLDKQARVAGLWFLVVIVAAPVRRLLVPDGSASSIPGNLALYRTGIIADLLCAVAMLFLTFSLRRLLLDVHRDLTSAVVIFGGILPATLYVANVGNDAAAITLAVGAPYLGPFSEPQRLALADLFLHVHGRMVVASELFWGLWLVPLSALVWHSAFLPRFLGLWLFVNGIAYIAQSVVGFAWPAGAPTLSAICAPI